MTKVDEWMMVPREPTTQMISAMMTSTARDDEGEFPMLMDHLNYSGENKSHTVLKAAYRAVIAAAQPAPVSAKPEVKHDKIMLRLAAIDLARDAALDAGKLGDHHYLPTTEQEAANWLPHSWVIDAIVAGSVQLAPAALSCVEEYL